MARTSSSAAAAPAAAAAAPSDVFVLDFDGVLVGECCHQSAICTIVPAALTLTSDVHTQHAHFPTDSEPEVSASAYAAARDYFPDVFINVSTEQESQVMQGLRQTRPVLVRGYESMVMVSSGACRQGTTGEGGAAGLLQRPCPPSAGC